MGALDFLKEFEGRALDAASYQLLQRNYEMQEENNRLLKEKVELLESQVKDLSRRIQDLIDENNDLKQKVSEAAMDDVFENHYGYALKRNPDGNLEETVYCPNCKLVMGNLMGNSYQCSKCKHLTKAKINPGSLARQLNAQRKTES